MYFCKKQLYCDFLRWWLLYITQDKETIDALFNNPSKTFKLTDEGGFKPYLGLIVRKYPNGTITMSQPEIIDKILNSLRICDESKIHDKPSNFILTRNEDGNGRKQEWHYFQLLVKLIIFLGQLYLIFFLFLHQCAKYSIYPKQSHEESIKSIRRYLNKTKDKGLFFTPDG